MNESLPCGSSRKLEWQRWPQRARVPMHLPLHRPSELNFLLPNWFHRHPVYTIGSLKAKEGLYSPLGFHCLKKNRYGANVDWITLINKGVLGELHTCKGWREGIQWSSKFSPAPGVWSNRAGGRANSPSEAHDREWPRDIRLHAPVSRDRALGARKWLCITVGEDVDLQPDGLGLRCSSASMLLGELGNLANLLGPQFPHLECKSIHCNTIVYEMN